MQKEENFLNDFMEYLQDDLKEIAKNDYQLETLTSSIAYRLYIFLKNYNVEVK